MKTAMHTVVRMKAFEQRMYRRYGGGDDESMRAPEKKLLIRPMARGICYILVKERKAIKSM